MFDSIKRFISYQTVLLAIICIICAFVMKVSAAPKRPDLSSAEKTIRSFIAAMNKGDLNGAAACVEGSKPHTAGLAEMWNAEYKLLGGAYSLDKSAFSVKGNSATAQLQVKVGAGSEFFKRAEKINLIQRAKAWKIVPNSEKTARQSNAGLLPNIGLLQGHVDMLAYPEELLKVFFRAKATAQKMSRENKNRRQHP